MGQDQLKDKMEDKRQRLIYCTKNTRQYQLQRGGWHNSEFKIIENYENFLLLYLYTIHLERSGSEDLGSSYLTGAILTLPGAILTLPGKNCAIKMMFSMTFWGILVI